MLLNLVTLHFRNITLLLFIMLHKDASTVILIAFYIFSPFFQDGFYELLKDKKYSIPSIAKGLLTCFGISLTALLILRR